MNYRRKPGSHWRLLAHRKDGSRCAPEDDGVFDELVVDNWLHVEQMDTRTWWMDLAGFRVSIHLPADPRQPPAIGIECDDHARHTMMFIVPCGDQRRRHRLS